MNVLILNQQKKTIYLNRMINFIKNFNGDKVYLLKDKPPSKKFLEKKKFELLISFHNGFIIKKKILKILNYNCINFHPSYLPKNKGAQPILFSAAKNDCFGLTIHKIDEKIDNGEYLYQKKLKIPKNATLKKAYDIHEKESLVGFKKIYKKIKKDILNKKKICFSKKRSKNLTSSFNYKKEASFILDTLPKKWNSKISEVREKYLILKKTFKQ